jgi:hypothetical protein
MGAAPSFDMEIVNKCLKWSTATRESFNVGAGARMLANSNMWLPAQRSSCASFAQPFNPRGPGRTSAP